MLHITRERGLGVPEPPLGLEPRGRISPSPSSHIGISLITLKHPFRASAIPFLKVGVGADDCSLVSQATRALWDDAGIKSDFGELVSDYKHPLRLIIAVGIYILCHTVLNALRHLRFGQIYD
jgi:hypothetical protein